MSTLEPTASSSTPPAIERRPPHADAWVFLREFLRSPLRTASVAPSSQALAARMIEPLHRSARQVQDPPVVVELGPGTGSFTAALRDSTPDIRYLGIELNPTMADHLATRFPGIDLVVSGLPWQAFAGTAGTDLVTAIAANLTPSGAYTQFTYSWTRWAPPGRRQHRELQRFFGRVELSPTVWTNLPPAVVYTATAPSRVVDVQSTDTR